MNTTNSALSLVFIILIAIFFLGAFPVSAAVYSITGEEIKSGSLTEYIRSDPSLVRGDLEPGQVIFFWNTHCGACHMAWDFLGFFTVNHPEMELLEYDLHYGTMNRTIFEEYKKKYHRDHLSVPSMMVGNLTLEGTQDIRNNLGTILEYQENQNKSRGILSEIIDFFRKNVLFSNFF